VNLEKDRSLVYTRKLIDELSKYDCKIYLPRICEGDINKTDKVVLESCDTADLIIVIGGDGSIIRAAHRAAPRNIPIFGINFGRVGYLAEIEPDDIGLIENLFSGKVNYDKRMMIEASIIRNGKSVATYTALNDIVVSHGVAARLTDIELYCNGEMIGTYRGDGLIAATPTGSTAYAMAAGGPIIDPNLDVISVVPICPHSLSKRPMIFKADSVIELKNQCSERDDLNVTVDGNDILEFGPGDTVKIVRSQLTTNLVRLNENNNGFLSVFYSKLS